MTDQPDQNLFSLERKRVEVAIEHLDEFEAERARDHRQIAVRVAAFLKGSLREESERAAALHLVGTVLGWFVGAVPTEGTMRRLAYLASQLDETTRWKRVKAVEFIRTMARFHGEPDAVGWLAKKLSENEGLAGVVEDVDGLARRLADVADNARGKKGRISAERLLAELVYDEQDALGFKIDSNADRESEVERVRKLLARDVKDHREKEADPEAV